MKPPRQAPDDAQRQEAQPKSARQAQNRPKPATPAEAPSFRIRNKLITVETIGQPMPDWLPALVEASYRLSTDSRLPAKVSFHFGGCIKRRPLAEPMHVHSDTRQQEFGTTCVLDTDPPWFNQREPTHEMLRSLAMLLAQNPSIGNWRYWTKLLILQNLTRNITTYDEAIIAVYGRAELYRRRTNKIAK